jgi:hypothetical protein
MAIRHRNNSQFYRRRRGARVGDIYMALIYAAELHGENPFEYLVVLFVNASAVAADPAAWPPWRFLATLARASPRSPRLERRPQILATSAISRARST